MSEDVREDPRKDIREELERLRVANGGLLKPAKVVAAARAKHSVLHDCFEWDDKKAGNSYRLSQAQHLIRSFAIRYRDVERETKVYTLSPVPEYSPAPQVPDGYLRTSDMMAGPERRPLLEAEHYRFEGHLERYLGYLEWAGLRAAAAALRVAAANALAGVEALRESNAGH